MNQQQEREGDLTGNRRRSRARRKAMATLTLRIDFDAGRAIGPGKIKLMELIDKYGSISEAGRQMGMSYRPAWLLVDSLQRTFRAPLVAPRQGGEHGGGASLTEFGRVVVQHYRAVESSARKAGVVHLEALSAELAEPASARGHTTTKKTTLARRLA
jgi:molybdate transport system regulatory protein